MTIKRVQSKERQALRANDLLAEQRYRLAMRRRHHLAHHDWGIVYGLGLYVDMEDASPTVQVQAGVAIDGYGRELVVPQSIALTLEQLQQYYETLCGGDMDKYQVAYLDLWLIYTLEPIHHRRDSTICCWREGVELRITAGKQDASPKDSADNETDDSIEDAPLRSDATGLTADQSQFGAYQTQGHDYEEKWPVYLGRVHLRTQKQLEPGEIALTNRRYASLTGTAVSAPSGRAHMLIGNDLDGKGRAFAVSFEDGEDRLAIQTSGKTTLAGATKFQKGVSLAESRYGHANPSLPELFLETEIDTPEAAAPWQVYRTAIIDETTQHSFSEMRFEIDNLGAGSRPDAKRFVIGKHTNGGFVPLLTVNSDCSIKVEQNITCLGDVIEMPIPADPNDPRFAEAMVESWIEGLQKSGATIDETYQGGQPGHTATLAVTINDMTWFNAVNDDYSYTVQVHNNGTLDIGNIQIQESIWWLLSWDEVRPAETVYTIQNLDPNTPSDPITIDRPGIATNGVVAIGVTATGVDPNGQTTTASHVRMMAIVPPPSAIFAVDLGNATAPASIDFDAGESTGLIHNYEWDFGDGTTQTGRTVTHEYTQAGTYNVKLTVTGLGGTHSITRDIEITETPPIA